MTYPKYFCALAAYSYSSMCYLFTNYQTFNVIKHVSELRKTKDTTQRGDLRNADFLCIYMSFYQKEGQKSKMAVLYRCLDVLGKKVPKLCEH